MRRVSVCALIVLIVLMLAYISAPTLAVLAQGSPGFTKIASPTGTTYTDSTVTDGSVVQYQVTSTNGGGIQESTPGTLTTVSTGCTGVGTNTATCAIPATGTHSVVLTWTAGANATGANVYRFLVPPPGPPTGVGVTLN